MGGEDVLEGVCFEEDAAGGGEEVVEGIDVGDVLEEGGHVLDGRDEAGDEEGGDDEAEHADVCLLLGGAAG